MSHDAPLPTPSVPLDRRFLLGAAGLAGIAALASRRAEAGPLTPPAGAVVSTAKPLGELEPRTPISAATTPGDANSTFRISQPGSYYLTGNVSGASGRSGIEIAASNVTVDLMGFALLGVAGSLAGVIVSVGSLSGITVRNGAAAGWGGAGIDLTLAQGAAVEGVHAVGNGGAGIVGGAYARITACSAMTNAGHGISANSGSVVEGCTARGNGGTGISTGSTGLVRGCTALSNTGAGIGVGTGGAAHACTTEGNDDGFSGAVGSRFMGCTAYNAQGNGFAVSSGSTVDGCTAYSCGEDGVNAGTNSAVARCTLSTNTDSGVICQAGCRITDNLCYGNATGPTGDGAGVLTQGADCHVSGNTCRANRFGYFTLHAGSVFVSNLAASNQDNWVLDAGNFLGPIVLAPASAAVDGDTGGSGVGSTNPHANFTF